jgi:hypothetical protein
MKTIIKILKTGLDVHIGLHKISTYSDGTMAVRLAGSGLTSPDEKITIAGLGRLLKWMDANPCPNS